MPYKYIYVDDTQDMVEQGTINGLEHGGEIKVEFLRPGEWENQLKDLTVLLPDYHGLILDLRLNDNPNKEGKYAQYRGSSIAQELRTLTKENTIKADFPIVLISANDNILKSLDSTSLDLFDAIINKNKLGNEGLGHSYADFRGKLMWLAEGYQFLNSAPKTIQSVLQLDQYVKLDNRFVDIFTECLTKPIHATARFLSKEVIKKPSFLINEEYLSARLGIDKRSPDWQTLLTKYLGHCLYRGAFSTYYPRWWQSLVEKFWKEQISTDCHWRNTSAARRVELIIQRTGLKDLVPLEKQEKSKSDSFWVACKETQVAIDTIDGFVIAQKEQDHNYPWQEPEYVCIDEAMRPSSDDYRISPIEVPRLQKLKAFFETNEQRVRK
jgi:hypothetical protein